VREVQLRPRVRLGGLDAFLLERLVEASPDARGRRPPGEASADDGGGPTPALAALERELELARREVQKRELAGRLQRGAASPRQPAASTAPLPRRAIPEP
jgi:hypothetical protein